jgi:hypothetical protein
MKDNYDELEETIDIKTDIVSVEKNSVEIVEEIKEIRKVADLKKDYEYTRANLYSLIEKGQEAINGIMELAGESDSPRAYEVAGQLIKSVGDVADKLIDLQKKVKDVEEESTKSAGNVTNNAVFIGSTSELSKLLKQGFLNNKE